MSQRRTGRGFCKVCVLSKWSFVMVRTVQRHGWRQHSCFGHQLGISRLVGALFCGLIMFNWNIYICIYNVVYPCMLAYNNPMRKANVIMHFIPQTVRPQSLGVLTVTYKVWCSFDLASGMSGKFGDPYCKKKSFICRFRTKSRTKLDLGDLSSRFTGRAQGDLVQLSWQGALL